ncbi:MAG: hypothetical protein H7222_01715 [Methylotenera sp.]|nr:hypothetical protein [Oligoflexia bacterium]
MKLKSDSIILVAVSVTALAGQSLSVAGPVAFGTAAGVLLGTLSDTPRAHAAENSTQSIQLLTFKTHSRLVLAVDLGVDSQWKETGDGFELFLKGSSLADLGAPIGQESAWLSQILPTLKDARLAEVRFQESGAGLKVVGKWKFPKGDQAPAHPRMERFEYREKSPARFIVDFWPKAGPTVSELRELRKHELTAAHQKDQGDQIKRRTDRKIASEKAKADALNIQKFCEQPLSEDKDIFLAFNPLHEAFDFDKWFAATTPDANYSYYEPPTEKAAEVEGADSEESADTENFARATSRAEEARFVRLALDLYRKGKFALVLKTLDFFTAEQPKSAYQKEMKFLRANSLLKLGTTEKSFRDAGLQMLEEIKTQYSGSAISLHSALYLANQKRLEGSHLATLESYLWLMNRYPTHRLNWVFHMAAAEELYALKQGDRAAKEYQWIAANAPEARYKAEGALRLGDIFMSRSQYDRALASYYQAMAGFRGEARKFPSIHLNRAEALYWLGQNDRAETAFTEFLKDYAGNPAGWRATLRLAEITGRREGAQAALESRKWFYQTINGFPFSPGATLARARLAQCADHGGFDLGTAKSFFTEEAEKFDPKEEVDTKHYNDFRALSRIRTLIAFGDSLNAVDVAIQEFEKASNASARETIGQILRHLFRNTLMSLLDQGKKYEALSFYDQKARSIPKLIGVPEAGTEASLSPDYLLKLSQAASDLGLGSVAQKISDEFKDHQKQMGSERGLASEHNQDLDLRLKKSEERFTEGKALWMRSGVKVEQKIRECMADVIAESPFSYEREIILGLLDMKAAGTGSAASALSHAAKAQFLLPASALKGEKARIESWVTTLQAQAGEIGLAVEGLRRLQKIRLTAELRNSAADTAAHLGVSSVAAPEELLMSEGELLSKQGHWGEAADAYGKAIDSGLGGNQALYEYARTLGKSGPDRAEKKEIQVILKRLAESKVDDFWKKLANRTLAGAGQSGSKTAKEGGSK